MVQQLSQGNGKTETSMYERDLGNPRNRYRGRFKKVKPERASPRVYHPQLLIAPEGVWRLRAQNRLARGSRSLSAVAMEGTPNSTAGTAGAGTPLSLQTPADAKKLDAAKIRENLEK
jgi:hypothetical protein